MRSRSPYSSNFANSFGPGPVTPAVKILIGINVAAFLLQLVSGPQLTDLFGLRPRDVLQSLYVWQPLTYMFLHGGIGHILFNMLSLWMFGVELERMWGTAFFTRYYLVCGIGAAITTILCGFLPGDIGARIYEPTTLSLIHISEPTRLLSISYA